MREITYQCTKEGCEHTIKRFSPGQELCPRCLNYSLVSISTLKVMGAKKKERLRKGGKSGS